MKYYVLILMAVSMLFTACTETVTTPSDSSADISDISEVSEESWFDPTTVYAFLESPYIVTATRVSHEITYVWEYYFIDGRVAGARLRTRLSSVPQAQEYYEGVLEDYPDAILDGRIVTHFMTGKQLSYFRYSLDKLTFVLESTGYDYKANFAEADPDDSSEEIIESSDEPIEDSSEEDIESSADESVDDTEEEFSDSSAEESVEESLEESVEESVEESEIESEIESDSEVSEDSFDESGDEISGHIE